MHSSSRIRNKSLSCQPLFARWAAIWIQAILRRALPLLPIAAAVALLISGTSFATPQGKPGSELIERYLGDAAAGSMGSDLTPAIKALKAGNYERALSQLERAKEGSARNKRLDRILFLEALAYLQGGSKDGALRSLEQSLALRGSNSDALTLYAELLSSPERKLDAITQALWFNRFVTVSPASALAQQATILMKLGQPKRAERAIASAIAQSPTCIECRLVASELALAAGRKQEAISTLEQSLTTSPDDSKVKSALAKTLLSGAQRGKDAPQIAEARRLAAELYLAGDKSDLDTASLYAKALIESEDAKSAQKVVSAAIAKHPKDENLLRLQQQIRIEQSALP